MNFYVRKIFKEWLLLAAIIATITTSFYIKKFPSYSYSDFEILYILLILFTIIKGIENSNFFFKIKDFVEKGRFLPLKLVVITYFLSMFITNDVALLLIVPLTVTLNIDNKGKIVILEALAANAGSALTPFGNPQNIFIYWFYHIDYIKFIKVISLFSIVSLCIIAVCAVFLHVEKKQTAVDYKKDIHKSFYIHILFLFMTILIIFHLLPIELGFIPLIVYFILQKENFKIDYILLLTFFFFFGFTDNVKYILNIRFENSGQVFLFSSVISQFISNVPSALLISDFTGNWKALLWGVNVGGYGNLVGSLANLIAYRIYNSHTKDKFFLIKFTTAGYFMFFLFSIIYFVK